MKDRISQYPNRIGLTDENGVKKYYTLSREDNPTEEGTKLNKANLLSDDTATFLGLNSNATVNDAINNINRPLDVKLSARTDLHEDWLLCNGTSVDANDYPKLVEKYGVMKPFSSQDDTTKLPIVTRKLNEIGCTLNSSFGMEIIDSTYVFYGLCYCSSASNYQSYFVYGNDITSTDLDDWSVNTIAGNVSNNWVNMFYLNGTWCGIYFWSYNSYNCYLYTLDGDYRTGTTWNYIFNFSTLYTTIYPYKALYANGYYVFLFAAGSTSSMQIYTVHTTNINNGDSANWTINHPSYSYCSPKHFDYIDGKYVCSGTFSYNNSYYSVVFWGETPDSSTWTYYDFNVGNSETTSLAQDIAVFKRGETTYLAWGHNGKISIYNWNFTQSMGTLLCQTNATFPSTYPDISFGKVYADANDRYIMLTYSYSGIRFYVYDFVTDTFEYTTNTQISSSTEYNMDTLLFLKIGNDYIFISKKVYNFLKFNGSLVKLPTISVNNAYAYIRAK